MNKNINQSISLPVELLEKLKQMAQKQERPLSWVVTKLILKGLSNDKKK